MDRHRRRNEKVWFSCFVKLAKRMTSWFFPKIKTTLQGGTLVVIDGGLTAINNLINEFAWGEKKTYSPFRPIYFTGFLGPPCEMICFLDS